MKVVLMIAAVLLPFVAARTLVGGEKALDVSENDAIVAFASSEINDYLAKQDTNAKPSAVIEVVSATKQIVSGILYRLTLKMSSEPKNKICDIEVFTKPWVSKTYTADKIHCTSEHLLGGDGHDQQIHGESGPGGVEAMDVDLTDEKVVAATSAVSDLLMMQDANAGPYSVVKVLSATKQTVAGTLYTLKLKMTGNQICDVKLLVQLWISPDYKITNIHCVHEVSALLGGDGHDQQPHGKGMMTGAVKPMNVDLTDNKVTFATSAVNDYLLKQDANAEPSTAVKVISATEQLVAGSLYTLKLKMTNNQICDIKLLDQPWISADYQLLNVHCEPEVAALLGGDGHDQQHHGKGSIVGGVKPMNVDLTDDKVTFAASAVNDYFLEQDANAVPSTVVKVISATEQVFSGVVYQLKLKMSGNEVCDIRLLSQPWVSPDYQLMSVHCLPEVAALLGGDDHDHLPHKQLAGGEEDADFSDEGVQQALAALTDSYNSQANSMYRSIPSGGRVTQQVVKGVIYRFKGVEMKVSSCRNSEDSMGKLTVEECPVDANAVPLAKVNGKVYFDLNTYAVQKLDIVN